MSLPIKQIASVPVQQPHEKVTISTLHPSLPPNDTVCGTANERIQSLNDDDIKLKTRRKTRSIQAIIAGQDESVADPPIQVRYKAFFFVLETDGMNEECRLTGRACLPYFSVCRT